MSTLKIISLGGFANVTKNMFVYETPQDILIVDCGVGFPEEEMLGVDLVIPDISYLKDKKQKIRGIILSHGHDDHIGGLPYILPQLPQVPVFGPKWAIALASSKLEEFKVPAKLEEIGEGRKITLGGFSIEFIKVTHSIPDTLHLIIKTPVGTIYHAADFKLDLKPVMGEATNQQKIITVGKQGVLCLLSDSLRAEVPGFTPPEEKLEEMFEKEIASCSGKFFVTTMSSNLSRLKQAIDVSLRHGRKIVPVGRSIEKNLEIAQRLNYLRYPPGVFVPRKSINQFSPTALSLLVAGSQAQLGSALDRIVSGESENIKIKPGDKVIFSTDYIPGNETAIYSLIDNIYRLGGEVVYQDIHDNVHVSGHGSQGDLGKLMKMVNPKFFLPIGGNFRHMAAYQRLAASLGFAKEKVLLPDGGQIVEFFENGQVGISQKIETRQVLIDALGVGDVGEIVLRDRQVLAEEGIVITVLPIDQGTHELVGDPEIVTRGFIYIRENLEFLHQTKSKIRQTVKNARARRLDYRLIRRDVQETLEKFFYSSTGRRPMVLPVIIEV
ncbi:ribonuclease J [Candidatus Shapirobacteria bacterium]|nr:ribonuclease J [Candidatus Shapirobacteria bacterium]